MLGSKLFIQPEISSNTLMGASKNPELQARQGASKKLRRSIQSNI
jgi:hypothetical protein